MASNLFDNFTVHIGWNFKELLRNKLRFTWGWAEVLSMDGSYYSTIERGGLTTILWYTEAGNTGSPEVELRFSSDRGSYCSTIERGGLTWALLYVPIKCIEERDLGQPQVKGPQVKYTYTEWRKI